MAYVPTRLNSVTAGQTTLPELPAERTVPPGQAFGNVVGELVYHGEMRLSGPELNPSSLLQEAWAARDFGTIRALLERQVVEPNSFILDLEHPDQGSLPILAHACRRGDTELVACLLMRGARPVFWMLAEAFEAGHDDVVRSLARHVDIDSLHGGISLLHAACVRHDVPAVDRLIRLGADARKPTSAGAGALVFLFTPGADPDRQIAVMTKLLDAGADIETRFRDLTPLALACRDNRLRHSPCFSNVAQIRMRTWAEAFVLLRCAATLR